MLIVKNFSPVLITSYSLHHCSSSNTFTHVDRTNSAADRSYGVQLSLKRRSAVTVSVLMLGEPIGATLLAAKFLFPAR